MRQLPHDILLKDYDYERPSLVIEGRAVVEENGRGSVYSYGEHFLTREHGNRLAKIRAEELSCRKKEFFCESSVPDLTAGYTFNLTDHFTRTFNRKYLITEVAHQGSQTGYLISGIRNALADLEQQVVYRNSFTAIPAEVQFRAQRKASKPVISGTLHAAIDAAGSGDHAELDAQGRYKVRLPFDVHSSHMDGKASCYVRMLQPHAGPPVSDQSRGPLPSGFHFPLRKGTEVLLTFINGDPDRPAISGAIPNPGIPSSVNETNQTQNIFRDHYGNELVFDSTPGDEHIRLYSPHHNSGLELGKSTWIETESSHYTRKLGPTYEVGAGSKFSAYGGYSVDVFGGSRQGVMAGLDQSLLLGASHSWNLFGYRWEYAKGAFVKKTDADAMINAAKDIILGAGDEFCVAAGTQRDKGGVSPENRSIIRATRNGITLSLGNELTEHKEGSGDAAWYKPEEIAENSLALPIWAALSTLAGAALLTTYECDNKASKIACSVMSGIAAAVAIALAVRLNNTEMKDEKIEPVTHADPPQKIWMHKNGTIGMVSTTGAGLDPVDGTAGKIVIGVNEQSTGPDLEFYNDHLSPDNRHGPEIQKRLGDGSNIIIKKESIDIRAGRKASQTDPDSQILLEKDKGIEIKVNKDGKEFSQIWLSKQTGNIYLDNTESKIGEMYLMSKKGISIRSGTNEDILLRADGSGEIKMMSNSFFGGAIDQKNFRVLK